MFTVWFRALTKSCRSMFMSRAVPHGRRRYCKVLSCSRTKYFEEKPIRSIVHLEGGSQGTQKPILVDGQTKSRDPRGPGMEGTAIRGTSAVPTEFRESRSDLMWTPPAGQIELNENDKRLGQILKENFADAVNRRRIPRICSHSRYRQTA